MATVADIGFRQDGTIFVSTDWDQFNFFFYNDEAETDPVDYSTSTFSGEVLDKEGGVKKFDLTFNTPANDGNIYPKLTDTETTTLTEKTVWYWVKVTDSAGIIEAYFFGELTVSSAFVAGS